MATDPRDENIRSKTTSAGQAAANVAHNVGNQAHNLGDRASQMGSSLGDRASDIMDTVNTGLDTARQRFNDARDVVVDRTKTYARITDDYVTNNPWKAVGIASGIALVLGMMLRRK